MKNILSKSSALLAGAICLAMSASADIKIKTRTTVMGHTTESTVYIKGARERTETSFMGHGGVTIMQCDRKRFVTISGNSCMSTQMGGEQACPAQPAFGGEFPGAEGAPKTPPRPGGTVTITTTSTDTGERQKMFGYTARHIRTSMSVESSPDACNPSSGMRMETDGWYADLSPGLACSAGRVPPMACGGFGKGRRGQPECRDRIVMKGGGMAHPGYPLKQTMTMTGEGGQSFTTTTEVVELTTATLDPPLFDMPPGCRTMDMAQIAGGQPPMAEAEATAPPAAAPTSEAPPAAAPAASPAPSVPKTAGVVRVGVVKLKDGTGQSLPTDNLRINLMSEITLRHMEPVPLDADLHPAIESEAAQKGCDYILYTNANQLAEPGSGGVARAALPRGVVLDANKFQALLAMTLYKVGKPLAELKDVPIGADADQLGVNAVMAGFEKEADKVAEQVRKDAEAKRAPAKATTAKPPVRKK